MDFLVPMFLFHAVLSAVILVIARVLLALLHLAGSTAWEVDMGVVLLAAIAILPTIDAGHGVGVLPLLLGAFATHAQFSPMAALFIPLTFAVAWWTLGRPWPDEPPAPPPPVAKAKMRASPVLKFPPNPDADVEH
ncbi:MAG TPA: hypothetical protein VIP05_18955 [Burkholderiaceae bacterium]